MLRMSLKKIGIVLLIALAGVLSIAYEDLCGKGVNQIGFNQVDIVKAAEYSAEDSDQLIC